MTITRHPHTAGITAALATSGVAIAGAEDEHAGDMPEGAGWQGAPGQSNFVPYLVLHEIDGGATTGNLGQVDTDLDWVWQVTAVGGTKAQCQVASDAADAAIRAVTVAGRTVGRVRLDTPAGARRDDTVQPPVWIATPRYRLMTSVGA